MSIYLGSESTGSFIVSATLSNTTGEPYCSSAASSEHFNARGVALVGFQALAKVAISRADTGKVFADVRLSSPLDSTTVEYPFDLSAFPPRFEPYEIVMTTIIGPCNKTFTATSQFYVLPPRTDGGSVTRIDYHYGGLLYQGSSNSSWDQIFPYSYYVNWGAYLAGSSANVSAFAELGYNIIHPTPGGGSVPFNVSEFTAFLDQIEQEGLLLMYDMRWTYKNLSLLSQQVDNLKSRKSILLWYTADEPDGQGDPLNATSLAYNKIKELDPYHPTSLVLNCYNFYYEQYTSGTDVVLSDPYPIAVDTSYSAQYHTVCNKTYGCCGCDDCNGHFKDVSGRMDVLQQYESWVSSPNAQSSSNGTEVLQMKRMPKSFWGVPQAFGGSEFWTRPPTAEEEVVMDMLFINHNAKGIVAWNFPTIPELQDITSQLAKLITSAEATGYLLGANAQQLEVDGDDEGNVDAAGWESNGNGKMLVSVVYMGYEDIKKQITVNLPGIPSNVRYLWPPSDAAAWTAQTGGLVKADMLGLEVSIMIVDLS
jgi:hypothetical protein